MATIDEILAFLRDHIVLGNSLYDYVITIGVFLGVLVFLEILRRIIIRRVMKFEKLQANKMTKIIVTTLKNYLSFSLSIIFALYIATLQINFPSALDALLKSIVFGILSWLILKLALNILDAALEYQRSVNTSNIHILEFFRVIVRSVIIVLVVLWFLTNLGVDVTSFVASLGVMSVAIAFALKQVISDIFASLIIFIDRPFEVGDGIKVDNDAGSVEKIGIRSSRIRAAEGHIIVASNQELTSKKIANFKRMDKRRVSMQIQIHQATPVSLLKKLPSIIEELISQNENFTFDKVNLNNIGDYTYDYELVYFVNTSNFTIHAEGKQEFLFQLLERFEEEDIMLPFPTQTIMLQE